MGGLPLLERVLTGKANENDFIELKLRPTNALGHPVLATTVEQNQIVLKVISRRRKVLDGVVPDDAGVFTVEYAGTTQQATHFRGSSRSVFMTGKWKLILSLISYGRFRGRYRARRHSHRRQRHTRQEW